MGNKIYENTNLVDLNELGFYDCYFREENAHIHAYQNCIVITDLTNALKRGKTCQVFRFSFAKEEWDQHRSLVCDFFNMLEDWDFTLAEFIEKLRSGESLFWLEDRFSIQIKEKQATRIYSPFAKVNPLRKRPTKWTLPHVWRAILAEQVKRAECTGYYTDDYAYDAACNYRMGEISPTYLAQKIIENPSGWWAYVQKETEDEIILSVNCWHFDNNRIVIDASNMA